MSLVFKVKNKEQKIKFDFKTLFKANKELSTKNPETGAKNDDGAFNLFNQINEGMDEGIVKLIQLTGDKKVTENEALEAMAQYMEDSELDEEEAYEQLFKDVKDELLNSGFFVGKLKKQIKTMEKGAQTIKKHGTKEQKEQIPIMEDQIEMLKKEIY